jgi:hypothetical protein
MALTTKHAQLLKSNRALLLTFESFPIAGKLSAVALALLLGIYGSINALKERPAIRYRSASVTNNHCNAPTKRGNRI